MVAAANAGFEAPVLGTGVFQYEPAGATWVFPGGTAAGISGNGSAFTSGNPNAPEGVQIAFLQQGSFSQSIAAWPAGSYQISFKAAQRNDGSAHDFQVTVDGSIVGHFTPSSTSYLTYTTSVFSVTAASHTVAFEGLNTIGGDNTSFVDAVTITAVYSDTMSGGAILGGASTPAAVYAASSAGKMTLGGTASNLATFIQTATGGAALGGTSTAAATYRATATGGGALGGTAAASAGYAAAMAGSLVASGAATSTAVVLATASGGVTLSGAAVDSLDTGAQTYSDMMSGGIKLSGTVLSTSFSQHFYQQWFKGQWWELKRPRSVAEVEGDQAVAKPVEHSQFFSGQWYPLKRLRS